MTPRVKRLFIVVIALQVVFLLGIVGYRESILTLGRTAVLQTVPVDPRDFLRGEYVVLRYEISVLGPVGNTLPAEDVPDLSEKDRNGPPVEGETRPPRIFEFIPPSKYYLFLGEIREGDTVYVGLPGDDDDGTQMLYVQTGGPSPETDLFIKGRVTQKRGDTITVEYGIEQYFVPEGRGLEIERADDVKVRVSINRSGTAVIKELIVDGEVWLR